jgi:hypothetical protein
MNPILVTIAPALNPDGRRAYSNRGPLFLAMVDGRRIVERTSQPLIDACRALLLEGVDPKTPVVMQHSNSPHAALRSTVGFAASRDVQLSKQGKPVFRSWTPPTVGTCTGSPIASIEVPGRATADHSSGSPREVV